MHFQEFYKLRTKDLEDLKSTGFNPYPHKFNVSISLTEFINQYDEVIKDGEILLNVSVSVAG